MIPLDAVEYAPAEDPGARLEEHLGTAVAGQ
jgi:hypothetical protein